MSLRSAASASRTVWNAVEPMGSPSSGSGDPPGSLRRGCVRRPSPGADAVGVDHDRNARRAAAVGGKDLHERLEQGPFENLLGLLVRGSEQGGVMHHPHRPDLPQPRRVVVGDTRVTAQLLKGLRLDPGEVTVNIDHRNSAFRFFDGRHARSSGDRLLPVGHGPNASTTA
ncbi:hypothetical protein [Kitasatospora herbaricolor]|uniref:Uncharacterized protein n=1 Tax=Kitasatospora herbaricolor TaxID=68217 RepID=A0ABZ1WJH7_9ACTN|nr:hypothetical protein [Kitasatospora herbaricolor]